MRRLLLAFGCLLIGACDFLPQTNSSILKDAQKIVSDELIDPTNPIFTKLRIGYDETYESHYVCGYVNSKNRFGAYAGAKQFFVYTGEVYRQLSNGTDWIDKIFMDSTESADGYISPDCRKDSYTCSENEALDFETEQFAKMAKDKLKHIEKMCSIAEPYENT